MHQYLPADQKKDIPALLFGDTQISSLCKDYYNNSFSNEMDEELSLWKLYNLLTGVNKSTFIDQFLNKSVHAYDFTEQIRHALEGKNTNWYLS
jgi:hypothetical protein